MPAGKGIIPLEEMPFGFVFRFCFLADRTAGKRWNDDAPHKIVEVEGLSISGLEDWKIGLRHDPYSSPDLYYSLFLDAQRKREELWLDKIQKQAFGRGLLICGLAHNLSFAFRLVSAGISAEAYNYVPYGKLHK